MVASLNKLRSIPYSAIFWKNFRSIGVNSSLFDNIHLWNHLQWKKVKFSQLCLTLCDPIDYTAQGILLSRILKWVAIPFSRWSSPALVETREAQEYWNVQPIPSPGDHPHPGIKRGSPALQIDFLTTELPGKPMKPTSPGFLLRISQSVSISVLVIGLFIFSISPWLDLGDCTFLRICTFLLGCPFYLHVVACGSLL